MGLSAIVKTSALPFYTPTESAPPLPSGRCILSVVMPCYNAGPYLQIAIASILRQTYGAFEFIIYDDGSTDGSYETALDFADRDPRIRVLRGDLRKGPVSSSRAAAMAANTPFVARMDADDIAREDRLELQLRAMLSVPEASVIGSLYTFIDGSGAQLRPSNRAQLLGGHPPLVHPSLMYRRQIMEEVGGYRDDTELTEDTDLLLRLSKWGTMLILPQPLIEMRMAGQNARSKESMLNIETKMNRYYRRGELAGSTHGIAPEVYHTIALLSIYRGTRPGIFLRALSRMSMRRFGAAGKALALLGLASLSPGIGRRCSHVWAAVGDRIASRKVPHDHLFAWRDGALQDLGTGFQETALPEGVSRTR